MLVTVCVAVEVMILCSITVEAIPEVAIAFKVCGIFACAFVIVFTVVKVVHAVAVTVAHAVNGTVTVDVVVV